MRFIYEDQGSSTFVIYPVAPTEEIDSMSLGMLTNNCIPGFAPASFSQKDVDKYIKYNVTGKVSAAQIFVGPVNKKRLTGLLQGIVDAMMAAEEYMLDPNSIELNLEQIYMDPVTCETVLLCVPVIRDGSTPVDLPMFLKNIVFNTQFDQTENTDHVAKIFNCLGAGSKLVLEDMKTLLDQLQGNHTPVKVAPVSQSGTKPTVQPAVHPATQPPIKPAVQPTVQPSVPTMGYGIQTDAVPSTTATVYPPASPNGIPHGSDVPTAPINGGQKVPAEKPMSTWYLLNHMSKENMAIYKAQQAQEKAKGGKAAKTPKEKPTKGPQKKASKVGGPVKRVQPGFAVPGAQTPPPKPSFDIPGQEPISTKEQISAARDLPPVAPVDHRSSQHPASSINFGATTVLGAELGGTTILSGAEPAAIPTPTLVRKTTGERVVINKQIFTVGIESYVDYRITGNSAVSRSHAKIIVRGNEFLLVDTNSTNGTYVNGNRIKKNVEVRIENGNKIVFANEEFDFLVC